MPKNAYTIHSILNTCLFLISQCPSKICKNYKNKLRFFLNNQTRNWFLNKLVINDVFLLKLVFKLYIHIFLAIMWHMDQSIGAMVAALSKRGMLENSIIIFSADNGGAADGFNLNAASNWPLRGVKNTLLEGGVRGAGLIWSPLLSNTGRVANQTLHIMDWLPTLYRAAGGDPS